MLRGKTNTLPRKRPFLVVQLGMVNILFHYNFFSEMSSYFGFENSRFL